MKNMTLEFKVGLFTLFGLCSTGYLFYALKPTAFERRTYTEYHTFIKNAAGIVRNSHVKTNGVSVGKVMDVQLHATDTKVIIEVESHVPIPDGSTIQIRSVGFLGDSHIEIIRTPDQGQYIAAGGLIPQSVSTSDLSGLIEVAGKIAEDISQITNNLSTALGKEKGQERIENIVEDLAKILENTRGLLEENRAGVRESVQHIAKITASLKDLLDDDNKLKIERIISNFDHSMEEVKEASKSVRLISEKIEKGDGTIGRLINDDKTLTELEAAIKDIRDVLGPATKLQIDVDARLEARADDSTQTYFNLAFKTRPDRYYLVGFTDTTEDVTEERILERNQECDEEEANCTSSREIREIKEKAIKFNLQFAKRWGLMGLRFGLFESTGGFGTDFYLFADRLRFTFEAFDWKSKQNEIRRVAHLKAYVSILFFDHLYLMAGVDDPTKYARRSDPSKLRKDSTFFGAGVTFNDEDLKALFGAAAVGSAL
jgi:phospholipid/cholesterol/gamma-HCH transport system substrate-binding protein